MTEAQDITPFVKVVWLLWMFFSLIGLGLYLNVDMLKNRVKMIENRIRAQRGRSHE